MGASESSPVSGVSGFQVVRVLPNSPAHFAGLAPWFDFIVAVDNLAIDPENTNFFFDYVRRNKYKPIVFRTMNLRLRAFRELLITPTDSWGGVGLLGCNVNWESVEKALESTWHIVDVKQNSPAFRADLMSNRDYILGMQVAHDSGALTLLSDPNDFHSRMDEWHGLRATRPNFGQTLVLLIFDAVDNSVKEVDVDMRGESSLGADLANGYLHVVPPDASGTGKAPVVTRFYVAAPSAPVVAQLPDAQQSSVPPPPAAASHAPTVHGFPQPPILHPPPVAAPLQEVPFAPQPMASHSDASSALVAHPSTSASAPATAPPPQAATFPTPSVTAAFPQAPSSYGASSFPVVATGPVGAPDAAPVAPFPAAFPAPFPAAAPFPHAAATVGGAPAAPFPMAPQFGR